MMQMRRKSLSAQIDLSKTRLLRLREQQDERRISLQPAMLSWNLSLLADDSTSKLKVQRAEEEGQ